MKTNYDSTNEKQQVKINMRKKKWKFCIQLKINKTQEMYYRERFDLNLNLQQIIF